MLSPLMRRRARLTVALTALLAPAARGADNASPLSLQEALRVTLQRSPELQRAKADVELRRGGLQSAAGAFDATLVFNPKLSYNDGELEPGAKSNEDRRRILLAETSKAFADLRARYADAIQKQRFGVPICPGGFTIINISNLTSIDQPGLDQPICAPISLTQPVEIDDPSVLGQKAEDYLLPRPSFGASTEFFEQRLAQILGLDTQSQVEDLRQRGLELLEQGYRLSNEGQIKSALALERLGFYPKEEVRKNLSLNLSLAKALPLGPVFQAQVQFQSSEDNYRNKQFDPTFGGAGHPNTFRVGAAIGANIPLAKGRGRTSADAPRRSARAGLEAATQQYRHTVAEQTLQTTTAYLDLIAAQETLVLLEQSAAYERELTEATRQLVASGEKARTELTRAEARLADTQRNVESGRLSLVSARVALAQAMGLSAADIAQGPLVTATFAPPPPEPPAAAAREALSRRYDVRAAEAQRDSADFLLRAARNDVKRKLDLSVRFSYSADYFGPFFFILKDEHRIDITNPKGLSPVDFWEPEGFKRAMNDRWKPSFSIGLTFELPFKNSQAKGRLLQSRSSLDQSEIQLTDLTRTIGENLIEQTRSLRRSREELARRQEAVEAHQATWEAAKQRRAVGDLSLIDTILTEQNLTQARLELVRARHDYAALLAQYRFETGTLVAFAGEQPGEAAIGDLVAAGGAD